jgi:hypothetical protein
MATLNFDAGKVEPSTDFEPLPAGKYVAVVTDSGMKATKAGNGSFLELTFEIVEGEFKGRKVWARLNLDNPNPTAVRIARAELSSLCRAVGVMQPKDSCELHNLPLIVSVKQRTDGEGEIRNEIRGFARKDAANPAMPQQAANPTPPWRRG